jgi:hypothetical protein
LRRAPASKARIGTVAPITEATDFASITFMQLKIPSPTIIGYCE